MQAGPHARGVIHFPLIENTLYERPRDYIKEALIWPTFYFDLKFYTNYALQGFLPFENPPNHPPPLKIFTQRVRIAGVCPRLLLLLFHIIFAFCELSKVICGEICQEAMG